MQYKR